MPAKTLRDLREDRGLSQCQVGVHQVMVSRFECGHKRPSPSSLKKIAAALSAAAPEQPVTVPDVVAACRESQRRALVARGRSARQVGGGRGKGEVGGGRGRASRRKSAAAAGAEARR